MSTFWALPDLQSTKSILVLEMYHVHCFEPLANWESEKYISRLIPVTRLTHDARGVDIAKGLYLLDGGAKRLVTIWADRMDARRCKKEGKTVVEPIYKLFGIAGATKVPDKIQVLSDREKWALERSLFPSQWERPGDEFAWNLFHHYLSREFS